MSCDSILVGGLICALCQILLEKQKLMPDV